MEPEGLLENKTEHITFKEALERIDQLEAETDKRISCQRIVNFGEA